MLNARAASEGRRAAGESPATPPADLARNPVSPAKAQLDPAALDGLRALDPSGANHLLERVFKAFEASASRLLPMLDVAERHGDAAGVRHVAHTLKSSSATVGALTLSQLCAEIETQSRLGSLDGLSDRIAQMRQETARVLEALTSLTGARP